MQSGSAMEQSVPAERVHVGAVSEVLVTVHDSVAVQLAPVHVPPLSVQPTGHPFEACVSAAHTAPPSLQDAATATVSGWSVPLRIGGHTKISYHAFAWRLTLSAAEHDPTVRCSHSRFRSHTRGKKLTQVGEGLNEQVGVVSLKDVVCSEYALECRPSSIDVGDYSRVCVGVPLRVIKHDQADLASRRLDERQGMHSLLQSCTERSVVQILGA